MRVIEFKHDVDNIGIMTEYFLPYTAKILREVTNDEWLRSALMRGEKRKNSFYKFAKKYRLEKDEEYDIDIKVIPDDATKIDSGLWINDSGSIDEFSLWDYMADIVSVVAAYEKLSSDRERADKLTALALDSRRAFKQFKVVISMLVYLDGNDYLDEEAMVPWLYRAQMLSFLYKLHGESVPESSKLDCICQDDDEYTGLKEAMIKDIIIAFMARYKDAKLAFLLEREVVVTEDSFYDVICINKLIYEGHLGEGCFSLLDGGADGKYYSFAGIRELNHSYKSLRSLTFKLMLMLGTDFVLAELDDETISDTGPIQITEARDDSKYEPEFQYYGDIYGTIADRRDSYNRKELGLIKGTFSGSIQKLLTHRYAGAVKGGKLYKVGEFGWSEKRLVSQAVEDGRFTCLIYDKGWK